MKWTTIAVILSMLLTVTLSGCGINIELPFKTETKTGPTVTEIIQVPIPDYPSPLDLNLSFGAGKMTLLPNPGADLLSGTATYNIADFKPEITVDETGVTLKQGNLKLNTIPTIDGSIKNEWNVAIASYPIELAIKAGGYSGEYEFGGLSLTDLHISDGAATVKLKFSTPNAVAMNSFRYETGASNITMEKLANANFQTMIFQSGAGNYSLDFSGILQRDASVFIETGLSRLVISVPEGIQAEVNFEGPLSKVFTSGNWQESGNEYIQEGQGPKLTITIETKAGTVTLQNP
ncbi:MAG: toast rack family protein [Anaerolineales bacterium]